MDDREAIEKTLAGQHENFGHLVSRYQSMVFATALARVYDRQDAEDISQETFLRAYEKLPTLKKHDLFAPWLFSILRRLCFDFLRGKWRKEQRTLMQQNELSQVQNDPRNMITAKDSAQTLWNTVAKLDDKSREILTLHYGQQLNLKEISALTGVRESAVKMRLSKARALLGGHVEELRHVWAAVPLPSFSGKVMDAVNVIGPAKGTVAAAGGALGSLAAFLAIFGWMPMRDVERWRGFTPEKMLRQGKRQQKFVLLLMFGAMAVTSLINQWTNKQVSAFLAIPVFTMLGLVFWREMQLVSRRDKVKQIINGCCGIIAFSSMAFLPQYFKIVWGPFLMVQPLLILDSMVPVLGGFWLAPLLQRAKGSSTKPISTTKRQIVQWLIMLRELGVVAPPFRSDAESDVVRLRLRNYYGEKMAWGRHSTLAVGADGAVTCEIIPRDYVALAQYFPSAELPGRAELGNELAAAFTDALAVAATGGDKADVAKTLGLGDCPVYTKRSNIYRAVKYLFPLLGAALLLSALL